MHKASSCCAPYAKNRDGARVLDGGTCYGSIAPLLARLAACSAQRRVPCHDARPRASLGRILYCSPFLVSAWSFAVVRCTSRMQSLKTRDTYSDHQPTKVDGLCHSTTTRTTQLMTAMKQTATATHLNGRLSPHPPGRQRPPVSRLLRMVFLRHRTRWRFETRVARSGGYTKSAGKHWGLRDPCACCSSRVRSSVASGRIPPTGDHSRRPSCWLFRKALTEAPSQVSSLIDTRELSVDRVYVPLSIW